MADNAKPIRSIAISADGRLLAAGSSVGTVRLWDLATGKLQGHIDPPRDIEDYQLNTVGFSGDGKYLAVGGNDTGLRVISLDSTRSERTLFGHTEFVTSISTPRTKSEWLLSAAQDGSLLEWSQEAFSRPPSSKPLWQPDEFERRMKSSGGQPLTAMSTTADGRLILTGGKNGQVQLWDGSAHLLIGDQFPGHSTDITAVALAPDGSFFVTADARKVLLWPGPSHWADLICGKLSQNMSRKEWGEWISGDISYVGQCPNLPVPQDEPEAVQSSGN